MKNQSVWSFPFYLNGGLPDWVEERPLFLRHLSLSREMYPAIKKRCPLGQRFKKVVRVDRIELTQPVWKTGVLPLNYTRLRSRAEVTSKALVVGQAFCRLVWKWFRNSGRFPWAKDLDEYYLAFSGFFSGKPLQFVLRLWRHEWRPECNLPLEMRSLKRFFLLLEGDAVFFCGVLDSTKG